MNQRIEKLADQCYSKYGVQVDPVKFTELIIREYITQIAEAIPDTDCSASGAYKTAKIAAMARVKEHFGLE